MSIKIAINGFGRIGRLALRALLEDKSKQGKIEIVAINDLSDTKTSAHLFEYDSVHGKYNGTIAHADDHISFDGKDVKYTSIRDPRELPWKELGIDIVYECSGVFASKEKSMSHIEAGAKRVIVSAPATGADLTVVYGVNHNNITNEHIVISNASCTTNCLAPVAHVLHKNFGIKKGAMTTIHAYTGDQRLVDTNHKDLRRARAAALSMIPTSTGAARAVGLVLPELAGKLDGTAIRVPTPNVSVVDFKFSSNKELSLDAINSAMKNASESELRGVLGFNELPLVSTDFNHSSYSSIFDATQTYVMEGDFARVLSWYDNEWGFSCRMSDVALKIAETL